MSVTDEFLEANKDYQNGFKGPLPLPPARKVAVLACMDARLDPAKILGLEEGDAHVIRNAGGVATDDAIRSLAISQRLLGTGEIVLVHHTDGEREFAYDRQRVLSGQLDQGLDEAEGYGWVLADMKQDWNRVFPG